jgi:hypothetical protein
MVVLDPRIESALRMCDSIGILSFYVGIDPGCEAATRPSWEIELESGVGQIRQRVREEGDRRRLTRLDRRLRQLAPKLARLVDPTEHGRGRALFAAVDASETHTLAVQTPLPTEATLGQVARVIPFLRVDNGHPRGIVLVGRKEVRVLESRLDEAAELVSYDVEPVVADEPERKGPSRANPLRHQQTVAQRERFERHLEVQHHGLLARAAASVAQTAVERAWDLAVVSGDPRGTRPVTDVLAAAGVEVESVDRDLIELGAAHALDVLDPVLRSAASRRDGALARLARDAAASGGRGAVGLADVLSVLAEGRVDRLLLDGDRPLAGALGPNGELFPLGVRPAGLDATVLRPEPLLAERMVASALSSGARVLVLGEPAAAVLADVEGVAALLRW